MSDSDTPSVGALEDQVDAFGDPSADTVDEDERAQLAETLVALADAYGSRGEFDAEAGAIDQLEDLRSDHSDTAVHTHLATALANATTVDDRDEVYEAGIDPERLETHRARLETLYGSHTEQSVAVALARASAQTAHAYGKAERPDRIEPLLERLETLYEDHPVTAIAAALAQGYARAELYLDPDGNEPTRRLERVEELYEDHPDGTVAAGLAGVVAGRTNADVRHEDIAAIEDRIARIETLAQQHPAAERDIEWWLPVAYANATRASFEIADYERLEHWGRKAVEHHEHLGTASSATWAAAALFYSARGSFFEGDIETGEGKLEQLRALEEQYANPVFEHWLARSMFDAARGYAETGHYERARSMAEELEAYAVDHEDQEQIESGLEALRSQAPGLFSNDEDIADEYDRAPADHDESQPETQAQTHTQESTQPPTDNTVDEQAIQSQTQELSEAIETLDRAQSHSAETTDSCGSGSCGSCGTSQPAAEPASLPTLLGVGLALSLVVLSVVYGLYRLIKVGAGTVRTSSE